MRYLVEHGDWLGLREVCLAFVIEVKSGFLFGIGANLVFELLNFPHLCEGLLLVFFLLLFERLQLLPLVADF